MSVPLTPSANKNWITARWACLEESMTQSLTVISLLFQSATHCRYRVYTKFLLTYAAIYWRNLKVLPLGITALQPQSYFQLGTPYILLITFCQLCSTTGHMSQYDTQYPFISSEPAAALALIFSPLLTKAFQYTFLVWIIYKHQS